MEIILLIGGVYNWLGAALLFASPPLRPTGATVLPANGQRGDYVQSKMFMAGAALTFGAMYFYLYLHPRYAMPFLAFGTFLKYWAFLASFCAWRRAGLPRAAFLQFGVANLGIAIGFTLYLVGRD
jgi:hypothetical protein